MDLSIEEVDILGLAKLGWDLYHTCYLVARDAPDGFRQLVNEVANLQEALRNLRGDVTSNPSFFDQLDDGRKQIFGRCLKSCFATLHRLNDLITRYQSLGIGDGKQLFWQKVKWASQRGHIEELRSKIMVHTCNIRLCMSSIENASLARLEESMMEALEKEYVSSSFDTPQLPGDDSPISPLTIKNFRVAELEDTSDTGDNRGSYPKVNSQRPSAPSSWARHISTSSESTMVSGQSDGSVYGSNTPATPFASVTQRSLSPTIMNQTIPDQLFTERGASPVIQLEDPQELHKSLAERVETPQRDSSHSDVIEAVESAMQQLQQVRLQEQSLRPLRFEPQDKFHKPDADINKEFERTAYGELKVRRLNTRDWLLVAVWWLLKARTTINNCEKLSFAGARGSLSPSTDSRSTGHQAYVDLMKSSYILYEIVLKDENSRAVLTDENRKLIADLSEGIKEEFSQFSSVDIPENATLHSQNLDIWEVLQPEENLENGDFFDGQKNARWITVEQEDAGDEEEKVLFRTFVNAGIGAKKFRMRTKGAPYMLLLSTRDGESEPKVTICNQSGTLCLQRDFVPEDLTQLMRISNATLSGMPGVKISEPVSLTFDHMSVSISFQYETDLVHFINIPKAYFNAVWQRQPVDSDQFSESVLFKNSVETLEQMKASTMKSMNPPLVHRSCEVRILERSFGEAWRGVRRMVISLSAAEKMPRCVEFFMPMARVQVSRDEHARRVLVKWSDTCQERSGKTDGNYNPLYSYVYDDNSPNIGLSLNFRSQEIAEDFEKAILNLSIQPTFSWLQANSSGHVYDVADTGEEQKQYKAIQLFRTRLTWKYCDIYYLYRNTDYIYDHSNLRVRFPQINHTDYISSHVDKLYRADSPVVFSHCAKKLTNMQAEFSDEATLRGFMSSLTPYELLFSRRAVSLIIKGKSLFGSKKLKKGDAEVQIWRKGNSIQLAARWDDEIADKWFTMPVVSGKIDPSKDSNQAGFPTAEYSRGTVIDLANIVSRSPKSANMAKREGSIAISFKSVRDREEFVSALEGGWAYGYTNHAM